MLRFPTLLMMIALFGGCSAAEPEAAPADNANDAAAPVAVMHHAAESPVEASAVAETSVPERVVTPAEMDGRFVFASGDLTFEVDPRVGGRIVSFAFDGRNFLSGADVDSTNYGSTFWTSPQSDWTWPPPPEIDNLPYTSSAAGATLVLTGDTSPMVGVSVTKSFTFDAKTSSISITYRITNRGTSSRMLAPWEVTRVPVGGITIFPTGNATYDYGAKPLVTSQGAGMTWFAYDAGKISADSKLFADTGGGILAQVKGGMALVKKFPDTAADQHAPDESEIEIFANGDHTYVEIETQGRYGTIAPAASIDWTVQWTLRKLPASIDASPGNIELAQWVNAAAAEL